MSDANVPKIRTARPEDASEIARIYIDAWQDTFPGVLPHTLLRVMTHKGQTTRWQKLIAVRPPEAVLLAEYQNKIIGFSAFTPTRDAGLGYDGEITALYVDPLYYGVGAGWQLLKATFKEMSVFGMGSCLVWVNALIQSRFFCEAMGAKAVAERGTMLMGEEVIEIAYGWDRLDVSGPRRTPVNVRDTDPPAV
ncbi:MAG: GNAT family N-acetyltransferase [Rhizomicrobium sp.]